MVHSEDTAQNRCRLVLVTPADAEPDRLAAQLEAAGRGGDVASVIVPDHGLDERAYQRLLERLVPIGQGFGVAVIATGEARLAARTGADGVHVGGNGRAVAEAVKAHQDRMIVGAQAGKTRHNALEVGEARPDYVLFGKLAGDTHPQAHRVAMADAAWWAELVEVPGILMGGNDLDHLDAAAATGVDFVALSRAVLGPDVDAEAAVRTANEILARHVLAEAA